jgi:hypothetical protein
MLPDLHPHTRLNYIEITRKNSVAISIISCKHSQGTQGTGTIVKVMHGLQSLQCNEAPGG